MGMFDELKRRNVFRVSVAYLIVAWLVAQIADLVLGNIGAPDWVMPALFLMLGLGFVAAVVISWAYELTPEGIKRERDVIRDDSITHVTAKKLDYITIAAVVGVLVIFGLQKADDSPATASSGGHTQVQAAAPTVQTPKPGDHSIAVLPFANRSNQDEDLFFTDGIHDDLLTQLAKISDLKVISRTSVMQYRETEKGIPQIAEELGVSTILEGGVQRAGHRIRINAQLIDVATDEHLWAETFDREMTIDNLFDIQSEITRQIVAAVRGELTAVEQKAISGAPTESLEAFEAYLRARSILASSGYNIEKYQDAEPYAELAVALDPNFANAHLLLAELHGYAYWMGYGAADARQPAAEKSLEIAASLLDADSPELLAAQGEYLYRFEQNYPAAQEQLLRAHAAMPGNAAILQGLGYTQRRLGLWEEAIQSLVKSTQLDPAEADGWLTYAGTLEMMQEWDRLEQVLPSARERFADEPSIGAINAMQPLRMRGDVAAARERLDKVRAGVGVSYIVIALQLAWLERDFERVIRVLESPEVRDFTTAIDGFEGFREVNFAGAYRHLGDAERADQYLSSAIDQLSSIDLSARSNTAAGRYSTLAFALAAKGEKESAIAAAEEAVQQLPLELDKAEGTFPLQTLCYVLAVTGERERALVLLAELIDQPAGFIRWEMQLDPRWDFFRDDERFNEMIRPHNLEQSFLEQ